MNEPQLREAMCDVGHRLWQRGLIGAAEGNISARLPSGEILCTPTGVSKGHLNPRELVIIDPQGNPIGKGKPSSEIKLHLRILQRRPDCMAVVHAHPPIATGFALAGESIPDDLMPESIVVLGRVATIPFCMPGTDEVPNAIDPFLDGHKTFLMSHHGAVVMGTDLYDAYNRMETLERIAQIILVAGTVGTPKPIPAGALEILLGPMLGNKLV